MRVKLLKSRGIYSITHTPSGRRCIGQAKNMNTRWGVHRWRLNRGTHHCIYLQRLWNKYGPSEFSVTTLEECSLENVDEREQEWMDKYHLKLLNACKVGGAVRGIKRTRKHRAIISKVQLKIGADPEERKRRSERAKAQHASGRLGRATWSEETARRVAADRVGKGPVFVKLVIAQVKTLYKAGYPQHRIARELKVSQAGVSKILRRVLKISAGEVIPRRLHYNKGTGT